MPKLVQWTNFPKSLRQHLIQRMADRRITIEDLNQLRLWVESSPEVPEGEWYKDFRSFKLCREGPYPKTFLVAGQPRNTAVTAKRIYPQDNHSDESRIRELP